MSKKDALSADQPGLEVVPPTIDKTAPETAYIENDASPPPQKVTANTTASPFRPSSHYGIIPNYADPGPGYSKEVHGTVNGLDTTSPYAATNHEHAMYDSAPRDLEDNLNRPPILSAGVGDQQLINKSNGPFWRKKKFWIIVGTVAGVLLVVGAVVGGVLGSQGD